MKFRVLSPRATIPETTDAPLVGLLRSIHWDDFGHQLLFHLSLRLADATVKPIGLLKILQFKTRRPVLANEFERLDDGFCSMGQSQEFYEVLRQVLGADARGLLSALRDLTILPDSEHKLCVENQDVQRTLLRFSSARHAYTEQLALRPKNIEFRVSHQVRGFVRPHEVRFKFSREHMLGGLIVLVGQNGTGKTQFLRGLVHPVLGLKEDNIDRTPPFSRLVLLSFSAFDRFRIPRKLGQDVVIPYVYCGLRRYVDPMGSMERVDADDALNDLESCYADLRSRGRVDEWETRIRGFGLRPPQPEYFADWIDERSAGERFVCFVLTMLLANLRHGAIVLFDEPELHTHPKMLALLMRQFNEILTQFDAFAIIATHSPIVLQEIPARQVRVFQAGGEPGELFPRVFDYPRESFGESLDEIMKSGFGIETAETNYMKRLRELVQQHGADAVEAEFYNSGLATQLAIAYVKKSEGPQDA